uniref:RING-type domain-containing protein n=1 Tax=Rhizophora mucronata TaxID=61149 RepID=A0A2P2LFH4_RHIMU
MDKDQVVHSDESEDIPDSFVCCVCLDLLYKPIVLSCGHISCFWCVHMSMNGGRESHCPVCRNPYNHFPTICQMLHFLLKKMYPIAHKRREKEIGEEEKKTGSFSPQFDCNPCGSHTDRGHDHLEGLSHCSSVAAESHSCSGSFSSRKEKPCDSMERKRFFPLVQDTGMHILNQVSDEHCKTNKLGSVEKKNGHQHKHIGSCKQISTVDVQCAACKQLLFRPVVLNCGHVYCETCITSPLDEMLRCQVCQSVHPRGIPKVCLEFDHFLEEQFPGDYILRRVAVQLKQVHHKNESPTTFSTGTSQKCKLSSSAPSEEHLHWWANPHTNVHVGVGCDYCGVIPCPLFCKALLSSLFWKHDYSKYYVLWMLVQYA